MNVVAFKSREFAARIGAVVVALVLAFSLVSLTAPARADGELDMKMWVEYSFSGDNITFSFRYHNTMQGSDHKTMCNKHENYGADLKYVITQYEGVEVCEMQGTVTIDQYISSGAISIGFGKDDKLYREGSNIVYEGDLAVFSDATSAKFIDYKITFAGGIVSAEGAEVSGNTAKLKLGGKFKVVGNPGSDSSNGGSTNGGSNNGGSSGNNQGGATASASPSASSSVTPKSDSTDSTENTVANGAPVTTTPTPLAVKSSKSSSDNTLLYVIIGVAVVSLVGLGAFLALRSGKKKPPSGMGGQFAYAPQPYGPGSYPQQQYPPQGNYPQQGQYGGYNG